MTVFKTAPQGVYPYLYERNFAQEAFRKIRWEFLDESHENDDPEWVRHQLSNLSVPSYFTGGYTDIDLFGDPWEIDVTNEKYGFRFLLSCYAIIWGIKRYHQRQQDRDMASHNKAILEAVI